jgi:hypothetical protein
MMPYAKAEPEIVRASITKAVMIVLLFIGRWLCCVRIIEHDRCHI